MAIERIATGKPLENNFRHGAGVIVSGRTLHTSGLVSRDAEGNPVGAGDMRAQIEQVFRNVGDVLDAAGSDFSRVVKYTIYVTDMEAYRRERAAGDPYHVGKPASTLVEVARLADPLMMVEVEAVAALE